MVPLSPISRRELLASLLVLPAALHGDSDWTPLFNGHTLHDWKAGENKGSFRVTDGQIVAQGPRSYLYYTGRVRDGGFKNFELRAEVMSRGGAESGIYFHTGFQPKGLPEKGFKVQVNNTYKGEGDYLERRKSGSLYGVRDVYKAFAKDGEWFLLQILVQGKQVRVHLNGAPLVDYVEPEPPIQEQGVPVLGRGTFALECHDPNSQVSFKNILVRPLADDPPTAAVERPVVDPVYKQLLWMHQNNFPVVDYHIHLKQGFTLEKALKESRRLGIEYGIAASGGPGFTITNDAAAEQFLKNMKGQSVFVALQGAGPEWVKMFSKETLAKFDYVFSDAMIYTDDNGKRVRIWLKEEVGEIKDKQRFMDMYVDRNLQVLNHQPIDLHASPTILPEALMPDYDELWTPERMQAVIDAAKRNDVALEIGNRVRVPSPAFIRAAKKAGVKFSFGTDNHDSSDVGRMEYAVEMVKQCGLTWQDIFVPKPDGEKPVQKRGLF